MTFAIDHPLAGPFAVTDRRVSLHDGPPDHGANRNLVSAVDSGGRLIPLPAGRWALGLGQAPYATEVLEYVIRAEVTSVEQFSAALQSTARQLPALQLQYPYERFDLDGNRSQFYLLIPEGAFALHWDGRVLFGGKHQQIISYPAGIDAAVREDRMLRLFADMGRPMRAMDYLRRAASEFAAVAAFDPTVSPTIEVGWNGLHLVADAGGLAAMDDASICALLRQPPSAQSQISALRAAYDRQVPLQIMLGAGKHPPESKTPCLQ